jgi:hypothetical protein
MPSRVMMPGRSNASSPTVVMAESLRKAEVGEACAATEDQHLDLRETVYDDCVCDLHVLLKLPLPARAHDGLRPLRVSRTVASLGRDMTQEEILRGGAEAGRGEGMMKLWASRVNSRDVV